MTTTEIVVSIIVALLLLSTTPWGPLGKRAKRRRLAELKAMAQARGIPVLDTDTVDELEWHLRLGPYQLFPLDEI